MPDYGEILEFLARTPPQSHAERQMHASLLELLARCLRSEETYDEFDVRKLSQRFPEGAIALRLT